MVEPEDPTAVAASLAGTVIEEEARRQAAHAAAQETVILPDDLLPGAQAAPVSLRGALRTGGTALLTVLFLIAVVDEFDRTAMAVLAPDIQRSLGVSDAVLAAIGGAAGVLFVLGAVPLGYLADRVRRTSIAGFATIGWAGVVFLTGFVPNAFSLFIARMGTGLGQANVLPVHGSLLSDGYPIGARGRVFAVHAMGGPVGQVIGPLLVGGIAATASGDDGWRRVFWVLAIPAAVLGVVTLLVREPRRGANEQEAILGHELADDAPPLPTSISAAFSRLKAIRTFYAMLTGVGALGFALFSIPLFLNLILKEQFDLDAWERGLVASAIVIPSLLAIPLAGVWNDRLFRQSPPKSLVLAAGCIAGFGLLVTLGVWMPNVVLLVVVFALATMLSRSAFAVISPIVSSVVPYRLRAQGFAMVGVYIFLFGAFFGAVITGWLSDQVGERAALSIVVIPSSLIGALLLARGATSIRDDLSLVVAELEEEQAEARRRAETGETPLLQVRDIDYSYGKVQVLFDVAMEVRRGEVLALLGTNGAGKSTLLRVISGLGTPSRGVVRLDGQTITFTDPEVRVRVGVVQVPGGKAVVEPLSVAENLRLAGYTLRHDRERLRRRIEEVLELFPDLQGALHERAGDLSGGQQQMLALAKALLLDPEVLLIDELSLGLAPAVVQQLLEVIEQLKARGVTMIIVEQSVNVALAFADRAVFMERGRVRFEGPALDLLERDDLLRAVFLGGEVG